MKAQKRSKVKVLAAILSTAVLAVYGCGGGGGGGGGGAQPVTYSSPEQAASSATSATAALELTSTMGGTLSGIADTTPASPRLSRRTGTSNITKLDPRLKEAVDKMIKQLQAPALKTAAKKAQSLKASLAPPSGSFNCDSGSITWTGTDTSTITYSEHDLTFTFNSCKDNTTFTEMTGQIRMYEKSMIDGSSLDESLTATAFTMKEYPDSTFTTPLYTYTFSATFSDNYIFNSTTFTESGTFSANGSFTLTDNSGTVMTITFNNLSEARSVTYTDGTKNTTTEEDYTQNGGFSFSVSSSGTTTFGLSISFTNLEDKWHYVYDAYGYETEKHEWINGRITIDWNPDVSGCTEGIFDFTTADATPLTYTSTDYWSCPVSGTLQINNATIVYGRPIYVTVGSTTTPFTDCAAMGGSLCSGS